MSAMNGPHRYEWTQFERNFMKAHFMSMTNKQIATVLGHKPTLLRLECYRLGLKKQEMEYWTDEQVAFLKENYKKFGDTDLAAMFNELWHKNKGWHKKHIEKKRRYLGLKHTEEEKKNFRIQHQQNGVYKISIVKTWDKIGRTPIGEIKTWNSNGTVRKYIRMKDGFVVYAHWLWEQVFGGVPDGYVVRLKDGNPLNVTIGNMQLVSRSENACLNRTGFLNLPDDVKEVINISNKIKKRIKEYGNR